MGFLSIYSLAYNFITDVFSEDQTVILKKIIHIF